MRVDASGYIYMCVCVYYARAQSPNRWTTSDAEITASACFQQNTIISLNVEVLLYLPPQS